jgi:general secretion pathway protein A
MVVVDEAHLLEADQLERLRLLTNFRAGGDAALTVVLVGQPSLLPRIERFSSFEERLGVKCLLRPLRLEESVSYISHRLRAAGCQRAIFDDSGMEALYELSGGIPRRINRLADLALLVGFAEQAATLDRSHVEAVCEELVAIRPD